MGIIFGNLQKETSFLNKADNIFGNLQK